MIDNTITANWALRFSSIWKQSRKFQTAAATLVALLFIVISYVLFLPDMFFGEEFFIFQYADRLNHWKAWQTYFLLNGRLLEGIYWTYLYKIIGFQPAVIRMFSMLLHLTASLLGAIVILRVWPKKELLKPVAFILPLLLFFNSISLDSSYRISLDNSRIAIILFWSSSFMLQQWVLSKLKLFWYFSAMVVFFLATITYENVALLFPAGILLALPMYSDNWKAQFQTERLKLIFGAIAGFALLASPLVVNSFIQQLTGRYVQHPAGGLSDTSILELASNSLQSAQALMLGFGKIVYKNNSLVGIVVAILVVTSIIFYYKSKQDKSNPQSNPPIYPIFFAGIWIMIFGIAPYAIAGYGPTARVYSSAIIGVMLVLLVGYSTSRNRKQGYLLLLALAITIINSVYIFVDRITDISNSAPRYAEYYLQIKELVPYVKEGTTFVFIDFRINGFSCGPSLNMLYGNSEMNCIVLGTENQDYRATRYEGSINGNYGGWLRNDRAIVFSTNQAGELQIVSEISPSDDLLIDWISMDSIKTNHQVILSYGIDTPFFQDLLSRKR